MTRTTTSTKDDFSTSEFRLRSRVDATFASSGSWRLMFASGVLPALALGFGIAALPESPRGLPAAPPQR
jgi:hypothetical protein